MSRLLRCLLFTFGMLSALGAHEVFGQELLKLEKGDHIAIIGNTLADRLQHFGHVEATLHYRFPEHNLVVRDLGFSGDTLTERPRSDNFGSPDEWLTKVKADVIFAFFVYN